MSLRSHAVQTHTYNGRPDPRVIADPPRRPRGSSETAWESEEHAGWEEAMKRTPDVGK